MKSLRGPGVARRTDAVATRERPGRHSGGASRSTLAAVAHGEWTPGVGHVWTGGTEQGEARRIIGKPAEVHETLAAASKIPDCSRHAGTAKGRGFLMEEGSVQRTRHRSTRRRGRKKKKTDSRDFQKRPASTTSTWTWQREASGMELTGQNEAWKPKKSHAWSVIAMTRGPDLRRQLAKMNKKQLEECQLRQSCCPRFYGEYCEPARVVDELEELQ